MVKDSGYQSLLTGLLGLIWLLFASVLLFIASIDVYPETQLFWSIVSIATMILLRYILLFTKAKDLAPANFLRMLFMLIAGLVALRYIWWRTFHSLPIQGDTYSMIVGFLLYIAEVQAVILTFLGMFVFINPRERELLPMPENESDLPSVDIYVPSYNEPLQLIKATLLASTNIRYPSDKLNIYLLDDGGTEQKRTQDDLAEAQVAEKRHLELQSICGKLGIQYLTREKNEFAKAGNINAALERSNGDLLLVLDCDHVPTVDILEKTVPYFLADDKLYLVQTPHFLINDDPVEKNIGKSPEMPSESEFFYSASLLGMDNWNSVFFCGSGGLLRRKCLDEIGGICTETVTEDIETSVQLHKRGYRSVYVNKPLLAGLEPETYAGFVTQRMRWAHGMLQVFFLHNPLVLRGFTMWQRICFANMMSYWFFPFMRITFLIVPALYFLFGVQPYDAGPTEILIYAVPAVLTFYIYFNFLYGHHRWFFVSEVYETLQSLFTIRTVFSVLINPRKGVFNVTPKDENISEDFLTPLAFPLFLFFLFLLAGAMKGYFINLDDNAVFSVEGVAFLWAFFNMLVVLGSLGALYERKQMRAATRVEENINVFLKNETITVYGRVTNLSYAGMAVHVNKSVVSDLGNDFLMASYCEHSQKIAKIHCRVERHFDHPNDDNRTYLGVSYAPVSIEEERDVALFVYGSSERWLAIRDRKRVRGGFVAGVVHFVHFNLPSGIRSALYQFKLMVRSFMRRLVKLFVSPILGKKK